jgi:putative Ca2+/H+ antiporter (TMEM165/GDT1 family)
MDWKIFLTTLGTIFLAEIGDKTQLATILMTSKTGRPLAVFGGAVLALSLVTLIGVTVGEGLISTILAILKKGAAIAFILVGWMFLGNDLTLFWRIPVTLLLLRYNVMMSMASSLEN